MAEQRDVGRKIARIDPDIAEHLNISAGDALELASGRKKTTVLSWPAREGDRGKRLTRIDGYIRNKLDVGINDTIEVRKVQSKDAKHRFHLLRLCLLYESTYQNIQIQMNQINIYKN